MLCYVVNCYLHWSNMNALSQESMRGYAGKSSIVVKQVQIVFQGGETNLMGWLWVCVSRYRYVTACE